MSEKTFGVWSTIRAYLFFIDTDKKKFYWWASLLLFSELLFLSEAYFLAQFVDFFTTYSSGDSLQPFFVIVSFMFGIYLVASQLRLTTKRHLAQIGIDASYSIRVKGFQRLLDFSIQWHDKEQSGNKVQRIQTGSSAMNTLSFLFSNNLVQVIAGVIGILGFFLILDIGFFLFLVVYVALFFIIERIFNLKLLHIRNEQNKALENASGTMYEGASNITTIKSLGAKKSLTKSVISKEDIKKEFDGRSKDVGINKWKYFQFLTAVSLGAFLLIVGFKAVYGVITAGLIVLYYTYYQRIIRLSMNLNSAFTNFIESASALNRVMPLFTEQSSTWFGTSTFPTTWKKIIFDMVDFSYQKGKNHLKSVDLTISRNQKIGVVGKSGSGKSTLAKLFLGLYKIKSGSLRVDATDYYSFSHDEITNSVAIVLQESELFNMSIKDNITMLQNYDAKRFSKAIKIAQLGELIKRLPQGMNTIIGEKGYKLSGGERQRLGIARALYKNTPILVLDEATSALDTATEKKIQHELEKLDKTMLIIAHRLSTLSGVDSIVVFDKGKIVEQGTYRSLARKKDSVFYGLLKQQKKK